MDFSLSTEQRALIDSSRALLADQGSIASTRRLIETERGFDERLWRNAAELGWTAVAIAEEHGGLGMQLVDQCLIAIELGRSLAPTPFLPTALVADVVARCGGDERADILRALLNGQTRAAWAFAERQQAWSVTGIRMRAEERDDEVLLNGTKVSVQDAATAQWLLVDVDLNGREPARMLVPADTPGITRSLQATLDVTRSYSDVTFSDVAVPKTALLSSGRAAARDIERSLNMATALTCAEMVGVGQALLNMTIEYVKERHQFGRPVGSFQAVKHKCADMRIWLQAATASTYYAAMAIDATTREVPLAVSAAKAYVSDAVNRLAGEALQLHGGIGFTWEHDLHLYLRRARVNSLLFGDARHHRELLCRLVEAGQEPEARETSGVRGNAATTLPA